MIYPQDYSENRPYYIEYYEENNTIRLRGLFKAQYLDTPDHWEEYLEKAKPEEKELFKVWYSCEVHSWNLSVEGELLDKKYPNSISFWRLDFLKFMVDSLNTCYSKKT